MARCEQGYLCEVCGDEVEEITDSDLYLRYIIGEIDARSLLSAPERHIRCNPVQAQFIVADEFEPVVVDGPFAKKNLEQEDVRRREDLGHARMAAIAGDQAAWSHCQRVSIAGGLGAETCGGRTTLRSPN